jgi:hypothetical protein
MPWRNDADFGSLTITTQYTVATVPAAADNVGKIIYTTNGAAGNPVLAFSDGTNWLRFDTRGAIAAS